MEQPKRQARLTPEEQKLKERLMRSGPPSMRKGSGEISEEFWKLSRTREGRRTLVKRLASSGKPEDIRPGRPVSDKFWELPRVKDPEGLLLNALLEDREQGR